MKVVLDANAVGLRRPLAGNPQRVLLDAARRGQITLVVPELTVREVVTVWTEKAAKSLERLRSASEDAVAHGLGISLGAADVDVRARAAEVERRLRDELGAVGAVVAGFAGVDHEQLAARALRREQPFDSQGHNGYRDALLWHSVLELVDPAQEVVLVSGDAKAFAGDDKRLARHLAWEAEERGGRPNRVRWVADPRLVADELAATNQEAQGQVRDLLKDRSFLTLLEEEVESGLRAWPLPDRVTAAVAPDPPGPEHALSGWLWLEELRPPSVVSAYRTADGGLLAELEVAFDGEVHINFSSEHFPALPSATDQEHAQIALGFDVSNARARVDARVRMPEGAIVALEIIDVQLPEDAGRYGRRPPSLRLLRR